MALLIAKQLRGWWRARRNQRKARKLAKAKARLDQRFSDAPFEPAAVKNVALLRWDDKLGDALMSSLFISALADARPDLRITLLAGKQAAALLAGCPGLHHIEVLDKRSQGTAEQLARFAGQFDAVVDPGTHMSALDLYALTQLRAPHYIGWRKQDYQLFDVAIAPTAVHFADRYLAAAELLAPGRPLAGQFYLPQEPSLDIRLTGQGPAVVINLFGSSVHRRFDRHSASQLLQWWQQHYPAHQLWLLRIPGQDNFLEELAAQFPGIQITPGPASLAMTFALLQQADLVFTPDTAVVHFASALQRPLLALFQYGPDNFAEWAPRSPRQQVVFTRQPQHANDKVNVADYNPDDLARAIDTLLGAPA
ncbi:glycosyltransferase family 9 protein [Gallaecimonas sp. GXIMD1310]|uniref:glycosyltransferase family 9 protein n=1 Tax=Gallaecimonas sp. GXIMD1310 TaxID=3131926 RepID=UPI0032465332